MMMAGLYDGSGGWAWHVGLPAKSGVGGGIVAVVPGKGAIAVFSPRLDEAGNSVKAQKVIEYVANKLDFNLYLTKFRWFEVVQFGFSEYALGSSVSRILSFYAGPRWVGPSRAGGLRLTCPSFCTRFNERVYIRTA